MTRERPRVLVPVTDTEASLAAVGAACEYAAARHGEIEVVHVIEVPRALPVDADVDTASRRGELVLRRAEEIARANKCTARGELLQARRAGDAILDEVRTSKATLIVLGLEPADQVGEFHLGHTVTTVLRGAACEVWLIRRAKVE